MQNLKTNTKNDYTRYLSKLAQEWGLSSSLYAATGCIKSASLDHKRIWENKTSEITYFFNKFQRILTGARYWKKEFHRQVKAIIFPESASMLHYHGLISIPDYYFKNSKPNISHELKEIKIFETYQQLHKKHFMNSCKIEPAGSTRGWINYATKEYGAETSCFDISDFIILP